MSIGQIWDLIILSPMINIIIMLSHYLGGSFGLTIIVLTFLIRGAMYPLTLKQLHASKGLQQMQAQVAELRKKYAKDRQKLAQEEMKLYKQTGMNPAGCLLPILIQMPIWIALYQSIMRVLAVAPEDFLSLSQHLYTSWTQVFSLVPLESHFLWLDLSLPDRWLFLPLLVGGTMWVQQKMTMVTAPDPRQQAQSQMMLWMMPMMFTLLTLQFPSGLALYWVVSNVFSIVQQYFVTGWGGLSSLAAVKKVTGEKKIQGPLTSSRTPAARFSAGGKTREPEKPQEEGTNGKSGDEGQDRGGSYPTRPGTIRRPPGGGRDNRRKRR
ncbi:MAG: YidC/Oxa1 family membrane protein insertase [Chloroflexota bacterium]